MLQVLENKICRVEFSYYWRIVLAQVYPLIEGGMTLKEALLNYVYPDDSQGGILVLFDALRVDHSKGNFTIRGIEEAQELIWRVKNANEPGHYWFNCRWVVCPDGTALMFE